MFGFQKKLYSVNIGFLPFDSKCFLKLNIFCLKDIDLFICFFSLYSILASVEMYDPHQDLWFEIASLPRPTMGLSATCIMDSVWLIGGITNNTSENPAECLSSSVFSFVPSVKK